MSKINDLLKAEGFAPECLYCRYAILNYEETEVVDCNAPEDSDCLRLEEELADES
jgi:hypothetical protein